MRKEVPPILLIIFTRLETTKQVFQAIREVTPKQLFIAADGARYEKPGEKEKCEVVRKYVLENIDWECEIKTLFQEKNLGCGQGIATAISWFFSYVEEGIILEDDCLPSLSFFYYCKELLNKYREDVRIYHIAGFNPLTYTKTKHSYYFARIQHGWGWASWRRAWEKYSFNINDLDNFIKQKKINKIFKRSVDRNWWIDIFKKMEKHDGNDIWDYQWAYAILNNDGICINPSKNLVTNIGFGQDATHTFDTNSIYANQQRYEISDILHPKKIKLNKCFINEINKVAFGINTVSCYTKSKAIIKKCIKCLLSFFTSKD